MKKKEKILCRKKDGWDFVANSPCALLGLIAIYEYKNPIIIMSTGGKMKDYI